MSHSQTSLRGYITVTVIAAITASLAAASALAFSLPVWAMFVGWIAFFTRGLTTRSTIENLGCVWLGLGVGALAALTISALALVLGVSVALPLVVFVVALIVVGLRGLPVLNNLLGYFLGLVAWFAAHLEPSLENVAHLAGAGTIGSVAGWISHFIPCRMLKTA
ncbi:DUF1097 domain-containing protein [Azotobacter beijerinckii]|uniref:DUF1097 domain-containing protein n=1 Tax=Azotobacter beijerinckii TaxID=170623 RepID=UPI002954725C|nr:DUF1097 domain-containing protein [Azotobacter beijerinckii]MDV7213362.1 DUF1097 domain-containing protein [Azotobacter beijerinckii]